MRPGQLMCSTVEEMPEQLRDLVLAVDDLCVGQQMNDVAAALFIVLSNACVNGCETFDDLIANADAIRDTLLLNGRNHFGIKGN